MFKRTNEENGLKYKSCNDVIVYYIDYEIINSRYILDIKNQYPINISVPILGYEIDSKPVKYYKL